MRNRGPMTPGVIGEIAGHALPSFGLVRGLDPKRAVALPLAAKKPYARAAQILAGMPEATAPFMNAACCGVKLLNVRNVGLRPGITGMVADAVSPAVTLLVKNPDSFL